MAIILPRSIKTATPSETFRKVNRDVDDAEARADAQKAYVRSQLPPKLTGSQQLRQNIGDVGAVLDIAGKVATSPVTEALWGIGTKIYDTSVESGLREERDKAKEEAKGQGAEAHRPLPVVDQSVRALPPFVGPPTPPDIANAQLEQSRNQAAAAQFAASKPAQSEEGVIYPQDALEAWGTAFDAVKRSGNLNDMKALLTDEALMRQILAHGIAPVEIQRAQEALELLDNIRSGKQFQVTRRSYPKPVSLDEVHMRLSTATTTEEREELLSMIINGDVNVRSRGFMEGITGSERERAVKEARAIKSPIQSLDPLKMAETQMKAANTARQELNALNARMQRLYASVDRPAMAVMADDTARDRMESNERVAGLNRRAATQRAFKPPPPDMTNADRAAELERRLALKAKGQEATVAEINTTVAKRTEERRQLEARLERLSAIRSTGATPPVEKLLELGLVAPEDSQELTEIQNAEAELQAQSDKIEAAAAGPSAFMIAESLDKQRAANNKARIDLQVRRGAVKDRIAKTAVTAQLQTAIAETSNAIAKAETELNALEQQRTSAAAGNKTTREAAALMGQLAILVRRYIRAGAGDKATIRARYLQLRPSAAGYKLEELPELDLMFDHTPTGPQSKFQSDDAREQAILAALDMKRGAA